MSRTICFKPYHRGKLNFFCRSKFTGKNRGFGQIKEGISPSNICIKERETTEKIIYALKRRKLIKKYLLILNCFILSLIFCVSFSSLLFFQEMLSKASLYIYDSFMRSKIKEGIRVQKSHCRERIRFFGIFFTPALSLPQQEQ